VKEWKNGGGVYGDIYEIKAPGIQEIKTLEIINDHKLYQMPKVNQ